MKRSIAMSIAPVVVACFVVGTPAEELSTLEPTSQTYATPGGIELKAYVFLPQKTEPGKRRAAVVLFHGGGWTMGEPAWAFPRARHFASLGLVAIAVQYRLSDQKSITPLDAINDARAAIRWTRSQADSLQIDPRRIAAYGWSAGGHLAAMVAILETTTEGEKTSAAPNALVLVSPAVSLQSDRWVQRLLGDRAGAQEISPDLLVRKGLPPTLILQGDLDTVTPLIGARRFCDRLKEFGNVCEMHVYEGFGHIFTPRGVRDDGMPQPDPATSADAMRKADQFLRSIDFVEQESAQKPD